MYIFIINFPCHLQIVIQLLLVPLLTPAILLKQSGSGGFNHPCTVTACLVHQNTWQNCWPLILTQPGSVGVLILMGPSLIHG